MLEKAKNGRDACHFQSIGRRTRDARDAEPDTLISKGPLLSVHLSWLTTGHIERRFPNQLAAATNVDLLTGQILGTWRVAVSLSPARWRRGTASWMTGQAMANARRTCGENESSECLADTRRRITVTVQAGARMKMLDCQCLESIIRHGKRRGHPATSGRHIVRTASVIGRSG